MNDDLVIPLFRLQWSTRAVYEGVARQVDPRHLHIIAPAQTAEQLTAAVAEEGWDLPATTVHAEENFFVAALGLTKDDLAAQLRLGESLYPAGWYYQQLLKLGAHDGIAELSDAYLVWDSDLLPVEAWPTTDGQGRRAFALLQDRSRGNADIVDRWGRWIRKVLEVEPITDSRGTFVPHHMWFHRPALDGFKAKVAAFDNADRGSVAWPTAMMRTANRFGTFSEFWAYASWLADRAPDELAFYPYEQFGETTERFYEDGSAPFALGLRRHLGLAADAPLRPGYDAVRGYIDAVYHGGPLPSSLSFEASPRHRKKGRANMHVEELRSRWHTAED